MIYSTSIYGYREKNITLEENLSHEVKKQDFETTTRPRKNRHPLNARGLVFSFQSKKKVREDLLSIYVASRMLILAYFILYAAFSVARDDGWGFQLYLLAWVLSLFAQFKSFISVFWLAVTTGVFLQGIGAYGIAFLCDERVQ
ncbi:unnamed protein product [Ectocarpus sp. 12 AP-2014]